MLSRTGFNVIHPSRARNFLLSTSALASGALRGLALATGVAGASLCAAPARAQAYAAGGGVINPPSGVATAVGAGATTTGGLASAFGAITSANGDNATAIGDGSIANGADATATGAGSFANGASATATGGSALGSFLFPGPSTVANGAEATATGWR